MNYLQPDLEISDHKSEMALVLWDMDKEELLKEESLIIIKYKNLIIDNLIRN